ncbi:MAG: ribosome assembly factor SBDS [Fervidicoccaceae archaeon]
MSSREYVVARYEVGGKRFEVLVDPERAMEFRERGLPSAKEVLVGDFVYKDAKKGLKASPDELKKVFGTDDPVAVAEVILRRGELQLTAEQRRKMLEAKRKLVVTYISRNAIDPRTKTPIPPQRIEAAMEEAKVSVDLFKPVEEQALAIVKVLSRVMPIKLARALLRVRIPQAHASRAYPRVKNLGDVKRVEWSKDGALLLELEIPAGMQTEVLDKLNNLCRGEATVEIIGTTHLQ